MNEQLFFHLCKYVLQEWVAVLREMVFNLPFTTPLAELAPLMNSDPEVDFFNNIVHIQVAYMEQGHLMEPMIHFLLRKNKEELCDFISYFCSLIEE